MASHNLATLSDFPEDVLLCILSFLTPSDIAAFSSTSKRFFSLCRSSDTRLWYALCLRRWGFKTRITTWGQGRISYKLLSSVLTQWDHLIGFWRRSGHPTAAISSPPLLLFEWGPSFITGSRVCSSQDKEAPFLWMSLSKEGEIVNLMDLEGRSGDSIPVGVTLVGRSHLVVDKNLGLDVEDDKKVGEEQLTWEAYQYFANRTSPGKDRRRQRRREKEKERRKRELEHFVKIVN